MPYYDVVKLVTVTKMNIIDEMPCGYGSVRTTAVRIWHQVSLAPKLDYPISQVSEHLRMPLQNLRALCLAAGGLGATASI